MRTTLATALIVAAAATGLPATAQAATPSPTASESPSAEGPSLAPAEEKGESQEPAAGEPEQPASRAAAPDAKQAAPTISTQIAKKYADPLVASLLGNPIKDGKEQKNGKISWVTYQHGIIVLEGGVATAVYGDIWVKYDGAGNFTSDLGLPEAESAKKAGGTAQEFDNGQILDGREGTFILSGGIGDRWEREKSALGHPVEDEQAVKGRKAAVQDFEDGSAIWRSGNGTKVVAGGIGDKWAGIGAEKSTLGMPTSEEKTDSGQRNAIQDFERGDISWTSGKGTHVILGGIKSAWDRKGAERGQLGYARSGEYKVAGGVNQEFAGGNVVWSSGHGAHPVVGAINNTWVKNRSALGAAHNDEGKGLKNGGAWQRFDKGLVHWSPKTGAHVTKGAIGDHWQRQGSERGSLGYPTSGEYNHQGGKAQNFQNGTLVWKSGQGVKGKDDAEARFSKVVDVAKTYVGVPYRSGGTSPSGWDCSGFTKYVYQKAVGISLPRTSGAQASFGKVVSKSEARAGDLVYRPGHVGIYMGNGKMIDAGSSKSNTSLRSHSWMGSVKYIRVNGM